MSKYNWKQVVEQKLSFIYSCNFWEQLNWNFKCPTHILAAPGILLVHQIFDRLGHTHTHELVVFRKLELYIDYPLTYGLSAVHIFLLVVQTIICHGINQILKKLWTNVLPSLMCQWCILDEQKICCLPNAGAMVFLIDSIINKNIFLSMNIFLHRMNQNLLNHILTTTT